MRCCFDSVDIFPPLLAVMRAFELAKMAAFEVAPHDPPFPAPLLTSSSRNFFQSFLYQLPVTLGVKKLPPETFDLPLFPSPCVVDLYSSLLGLVLMVSSHSITLLTYFC